MSYELESMLVDVGVDYGNARVFAKAVDRGVWGRITASRLATLMWAYASKHASDCARRERRAACPHCGQHADQLTLFNQTPVGR